MNKKQLIVAWIIGIIISLICLNPVRYHGLVRYGRPNIDFIRTILFIIPILILGILLIYTLRNDEMAKQIKADIIKLSSQIYKKIAQLLSRIWLFMKRVFIKELIILVIILLTGFIISMSSVLFPSPRTLPLSEFLAEGITHPEYKASFTKVFKHKFKYPEYENISLLDFVEKLAKENIEYQKDYENLKALSKENAENNEFDMVTAVPMFGVKKPSPLERILGFIKNYPEKRNIANLGFFIIIFGYPIVLLIRFIIWTIRIPKKPE